MLDGVLQERGGRQGVRVVVGCGVDDACLRRRGHQRWGGVGQHGGHLRRTDEVHDGCAGRGRGTQSGRWKYLTSGGGDQPRALSRCGHRCKRECMVRWCKIADREERKGKKQREENEGTETGEHRREGWTVKLNIEDKRVEVKQSEGRKERKRQKHMPDLNFRFEQM